MKVETTFNEKLLRMFHGQGPHGMDSGGPI
jgi:hypothetical protein